MFDLIKKILSAPEKPVADEYEKVQVATCVLMVAMADTDDNLHPVEEEMIQELLAGHFDLDEQTTDELIAYAKEAHDEAVDLYRFTATINESFSRAEKMAVLENLWRIVYADGVVDKYEDAMMRQITALFRFHHHEMIELKLKVACEINGTKNA